MARPVITIGGREVALETRPANSASTNALRNRQPVTIAALFPRPTGQDGNTRSPAAVPLSVAGGILLLGLIVLLVLRHVRRNCAP